MADQSRTSRFRAQFESALQSYQRETSVTLAEHSLAIQLQSCHPIESIITLLQNEARAFSDLPGSDKIMKSIEDTVAIVSAISVVLSLGEIISHSLSPAHAIYAGLAILLDAAKGVITSFDALVDLFESIEQILKCLNIYTRIPPTPAMDDIVVKILVELLTTLALATREFNQGRSIKFVKKAFGEEDVEAVLQRIDRLTQDEARITAPEILNIIHGLVQGIRVVMEDGKASIDDVREDLRILHQMASNMNRLNRDRLIRDILSWLSPPDPWINHNMAYAMSHHGTGVWLVNGSIFSEWKVAGQSSLLWIHGKPGSGKTVICSRIIEEIATMRNFGLASLAMFYHDFRDHQKKDLRGLLSSVLVQLYHQSDSYCAILSKLFTEHGNGSRQPSNDALVCCFNNMVNLPQQAPIFLIVDALDECPNPSGLPTSRQEVLLFINDLVESQLPNLRICVTSRPEVDITQDLIPLTFRSISLHNERGHIEDINNYIKSVVRSDSRMRRWRAKDNQLVIDVLTERADGIFQWVYCQLDYLRHCLPGYIRHALDELPETLDGTYERVLCNIHKSEWEFTRRLLLCVSASYHPFTMEELAEFLAFDFEASLIPKYREDWRLENPVDAVLSTYSILLCLVNVDESPVLQFSHFSVGEFLTPSYLADHVPALGRYHLSIASGHILVARACLGILLHLDENVTTDSLTSSPLAEYAAKHWIEHARFEGVSQAVEEGMRQLFDPGKPHFAIWLWIHDPIRMPHERAERPAPPLKTPLHYATFLGFHSVVKFLVLEHSQDVNSPAIDDGSTPLHLASQTGHAEVARFLVEHGADTTSQDRGGSTPLHRGSGTGLMETSRILVEHGADVTAQDLFGSTALHQASLHGNLGFARFLVEHGAVATTKDQCGSTPLHHASFNGDLDLARFLVEQGADATAQDKFGSTPLHYASYNGNLGLGRFLVEQGADATAQDKFGSTPLHHAPFNGHLDIARFLIEHGANAPAQNQRGRTPLHHASFNGHVDLVRFLVKHGADVTIRDKEGWSPLHQVSRYGHLYLARFLVEHGADVSAQDKLGSTPLHQASLNGHLVIAQFLVEHEADVTTKDQCGSTPLHHASFNGDLDLARFLVEQGADTTAQDLRRSTPLHQASSNRHLALARFLVEHGADASAKDKDGLTPLHRALEEGNVNLALFLIQRGADVTTQDKDGFTLLHWASELGRADLVQLLLKRSADVTAQDNFGSTPLHRASEKSRVVVAQVLLAYGADATAQDKDGSTPLHRAMEGGNVDLARLLLEHGANATAHDKLGSTPLHQASLNGHLDLARLLVEHRADTMVQDDDGSTPLHRALVGENVDLVRFLVENNAGASAQNKLGSTPLHHASFIGHLYLARFLVDHGADVTAQDRRGWTPLHQASFMGHVDLARFLIELGAYTTARDKHGLTPLHQASRYGHLDLARILVDHGANVTTQDQWGSTPLHQASFSGHLDLAQFLMEHGADSASQDRHGLTPLHQTSFIGHVDIAQFLVEHGANVGAQDKRGLTPVHWASRYGHVDLVRVLVEHGAEPTDQGWHGATAPIKRGHTVTGISHSSWQGTPPKQ